MARWDWRFVAGRCRNCFRNYIRLRRLAHVDVFFLLRHGCVVVCVAFVVLWLVWFCRMVASLFFCGVFPRCCPDRCSLPERNGKKRTERNGSQRTRKQEEDSTRDSNVTVGLEQVNNYFTVGVRRCRTRLQFVIIFTPYHTGIINIATKRCT